MAVSVKAIGAIGRWCSEIAGKPGALAKIHSQLVRADSDLKILIKKRISAKEARASLSWWLGS